VGEEPASAWIWQGVAGRSSEPMCPYHASLRGLGNELLGSLLHHSLHSLPAVAE
jgi:hypothetical protein